MRKINNEKNLQEKPENRHQAKQVEAQRDSFKFISAVIKQIKLKFVPREGVWRDVDEKQRIIKIKKRRVQGKEI